MEETKYDEGYEMTDPRFYEELDKEMLFNFDYGFSIDLMHIF